MLVLEVEQLSRDQQIKIMSWLEDARCDEVLRAANAEQQALQAEYANALLKNPLEAIGLPADTEKERRLLASAARIAIFIEVLKDLRNPTHKLVSVKLSENTP